MLNSRRALDTRSSLALLIVVIVSLALYLPTLGYGFIYDDIPLLTQNPAIRSFELALGYFSRDFDAYTRGLEGVQSNYYRPLVFLFMAAFWPWAGDDPARWHALVVVLNALVGGLGFAILRSHGLSPARALFGALLFSLHPLHVHSAAWITGLHDVLAAILVMLGYLGLIRWLGLNADAPRDRARGAWLVLYLLAFAAALLAKESSIGLGVLALGLAACCAVTDATSRRRSLALAGATLLLVFAYLALRWRILGTLAAPFPSAPAWPLAGAGIAPLFWAYVGAWLWPLDLSLFSSFRPATSIASGAVLLGWAGAAAVGVALLWRIRLDRRYLFPTLWFFAFLAPHLNLRVLNPEWALMHRYLYLASLGLAWGVAMLPLTRLDARIRVALAVLVLTLLGAGSLHDMRAYSSESAFWDRAVRKDPASSAAWTEQGRLRLAEGDTAAALVALKRAIELDPLSLLPRLRLGNLQFARGEHAAAATTYRAILSQRPEYTPAWRNLPTATLAAGDARGALEAARQARARLAGDAPALAQLGVVFRLAGDSRAALETFGEVVRIRPDDADSWLKLATLQAESGATEDARASVSQVRRHARQPSLRAAADRLEASLPDRP